MKCNSNKVHKCQLQHKNQKHSSNRELIITGPKEIKNQFSTVSRIDNVELVGTKIHILFSYSDLQLPS